SGDEASGTGARPTSTKPSDSIRATLPCSPSTRFPIWTFVVSRKHCESLIRCSISHRTTWIRLRSRPVSRKPKGICQGPLRFLLHFTLVLTTSAHSKHRFTKRSSNAVLYLPFLGYKRYWSSLIQRWVISMANCAFG